MLGEYTQYSLDGYRGFFNTSQDKPTTVALQSSFLSDVTSVSIQLRSPLQDTAVKFFFFFFKIFYTLRIL